MDTDAPFASIDEFLQFPGHTPHDVCFPSSVLGETYMFSRRNNPRSVEKKLDEAGDHGARREKR